MSSSGSMVSQGLPLKSPAVNPMKDLQLPVVITEAALLVSALNVSSFDSCRLISTLAKPPSIAVRASAEATARSDHMFLLVIGLSDSTSLRTSWAFCAIPSRSEEHTSELQSPMYL